MSTQDKDTIRNIKFNVKRGELLMVIGSVGSGKSTLLLSILGEVPTTTEEKPKMPNNKIKIAYCAQKPWIMASTVKRNICIGGMGESSDGSFNESLYKLAVESSRIVEDLHSWPEYDETEIGERGVSVSGGQKARIALARAVFSDADCK